MAENCNEDTITMDEALSFIASYCGWNPVANENAAARRLIAAEITNEQLDKLNLPGNADLQDHIDNLLYGDKIL